MKLAIRAEGLSRRYRVLTHRPVERFLDTPVQRYSSGMHVRLSLTGL
jgi:ABC-type polysaccharide/polyol phosphate transport system ATPase subunit